MNKKQELDLQDFDLKEEVDSKEGIGPTKDISVLFSRNVESETSLPVWIRQQIPDSADFKYYDFMDLSEDHLVFESKLVKEIMAFDCSYSNEHHGFLYIKFQDNSTTIRKVKDGFYTMLQGWSRENRTRRISSFEKRKNISRPNWENTPVKIFYIRDVSLFYSGLHSFFIKYLFALPGLTKETHIELVDGGCGDGRFFVKLSRRIKTELPVKSINFYGIDAYPQNIEDCEDNLLSEHDHKFEHCEFKMHDLTKIDDFLKGIIKEKNITHVVNVVILSGSITRGVLDNGFEALTCLQQIGKNNIDFIMIGGREEPIVSDFIAHQLGYEKANRELKEGIYESFFCYRKMPQGKILTSKKDEIKQEKFLDLSLSPDPLFILSNLTAEELANIWVIDLSFCNMSEKLMDYLDQRIMVANNKIKLIYWHYDQEMVDNFEYRFNLDLRRKLDVAATVVEDDIYLIGGRRFFTTLLTKNAEMNSTKRLLDGTQLSGFERYENFITSRVEKNINVRKDFVFEYLKLWQWQQKAESDQRNYLLEEAIKSVCEKLDISEEGINNFLRFVLRSKEIYGLEDSDVDIYRKKIFEKSIEAIIRSEAKDVNDICVSFINEYKSRELFELLITKIKTFLSEEVSSPHRDLINRFLYSKSFYYKNFTKITQIFHESFHDLNRFYIVLSDTDSLVERIRNYPEEYPDYKNSKSAINKLKEESTNLLLMLGNDHLKISDLDDAYEDLRHLFRVMGEGNALKITFNAIKENITPEHDLSDFKLDDISGRIDEIYFRIANSEITNAIGLIEIVYEKIGKLASKVDGINKSSSGLSLPLSKGSDKPTDEDEIGENFLSLLSSKKNDEPIGIDEIGEDFLGLQSSKENDESTDKDEIGEDFLKLRSFAEDDASKELETKETKSSVDNLSEDQDPLSLSTEDVQLFKTSDSQLEVKFGSSQTMFHVKRSSEKKDELRLTGPAIVKKLLKPTEPAIINPEAKYLFQEGTLFPFQISNVASNGNCTFNAMAQGIERLPLEEKQLIYETLKKILGTGRNEFKTVDADVLRNAVVRKLELDIKKQDETIVENIVNMGLIPLLADRYDEMSELLLRSPQIKMNLFYDFRNARQQYLSGNLETNYENAELYRHLLSVSGVWGGEAEIPIIEELCGIHIQIRQQANLDRSRDTMLAKLRNIVGSPEHKENEHFRALIKGELRQALDKAAREGVDSLSLGGALTRKLGLILPELAPQGHPDEKLLKNYLDSPSSLKLYCDWFKVKRLVTESALEEDLYERCLVDKYGNQGLSLDLLKSWKARGINIRNVHFPYGLQRQPRASAENGVVQVVFTGDHYNLVERVPTAAAVDLQTSASDSNSGSGFSLNFSSSSSPHIYISFLYSQLLLRKYRVISHQAIQGNLPISGQNIQKALIAQKPPLHFVAELVQESKREADTENLLRLMVLLINDGKLSPDSTLKNYVAIIGKEKKLTNYAWDYLLEITQWVNSKTLQTGSKDSFFIEFS
ncbi:MAG: hypothetical protein JSR33_05880 [Proteobacteria bacterium]|nr:hypothetical protein [Pseudomonadota bacterium]